VTRSLPKGMHPAFRRIALSRTPVALPLVLALGLTACSSVNKTLEGDKVDYRSVGTKTVTLEVPPDLSQLQRDSRYQQTTTGTVSAAALQSTGGTTVATVATAAPVAPSQIGELKIQRDGTQRWLSTPLTPEQIWPQLEAFWQERGFTLETDTREVGLMETDWVENRAKLPQDFIRNTIGKVFSNLYDTGERDRFRTRVERTPSGSEVYISHRGMVEVYSTKEKDQTVWQPRPSDPDLEALMLSRLMLKLGAKDEQAKVAAAAAPNAAASAAETPARARLLAGPPGTGMQVDETFDRAWRRVGLALDRTGFTVEDRDRAKGLFYVRYVDPAQAGKGEPNWISRLFSAGKEVPPQGGLARYRIALKGEGNGTLVSVLNNQGGPETGDAAQHILQMLVNELK